MFLKCNNLKCREDAHKKIYITPCSHVFCGICATQIQRMNLCIACKSFIKDREMISKSLDLPPCLLGYPPEEIFESAQKALSFWLYQCEQEITIANVIQERAENAQQKMNQNFMLQRNKFEIEKMNFKSTIEKLEQKLEKEKEYNYDLSVLLSDKTKQYQNAIRDVERLRYKNGNSKTILRFNGDDE
ncbi:E3 ubiquitin-protein ligase CCNB1IP1 [Dictyocoela muelleri]|nr:E3 ubiquitin-protein ligase CCNB1IP1 [Dictyocoela muelleri]